MPSKVAVPAIGALVEVRGQRWVVTDVSGTDTSTLVELQSVDDGRYGHTLSVIWEVEQDRRLLPAGSLPELNQEGFDPPDRLAAFLDAVRWSAVTSAEIKTLQAPFRSGVAVEDYQLEPLARAVDAPRVNLLLADDVGLGKTIEAGLVAQELLLRHRARRVMIVCPAGLTIKWKDEMADKFGLSFVIVDSTQCAALRRSQGSAANPFRVYPLVIVSLPWLRGVKAQRLLDGALSTDERLFELLILDEAHHVAPAAPKQEYAVDSQQTRLIRRLGRHFEHRLFLSATPHNGYSSSFTALLEIIDDQRFARGVEPTDAALADTVVRRLKRAITEPDGRERFPERVTTPISVTYPDSEREVHQLLQEFARLRRQRIGPSQRGRKAADLVTLLLKKRLFSSPAAFANTVGVYLETLASRSGVTTPPGDDVPEWLDTYYDDLSDLDDEQLDEAEHDALAQTSLLQPGADSGEVELLERMATWAARHDVTPDAKACELIKYLRAVCCPDSTHWTNERVVVFTEYRDTQSWLVKLLGQESMAGERVAVLHGGISGDDREQLRLGFQAVPIEHPVRILIATDAASEGIDLQNHCHRLVNYDIPFNPNKLEQRIGRIDRYGQRNSPEVRHFVGVGWERAANSYEADLEFLSRVAVKVARMEEDLGSVNAVLADAVQRRMVGDLAHINSFDVPRAAPKSRRGRGTVRAESNVGEQIARLRKVVDTTIVSLGIKPSNIERVVRTALNLARQHDLIPVPDDRDPDTTLFEVPPLTGAWVRATDGLWERLHRVGQPPRQRPITFDPQIARGRDDVVLAHLAHPLVALSTRLLRAAIWNPEASLRRVTAVVSDDPGLETTLLGAYARFVLVGADGVRLHEEVLYAGGWLRDRGFESLRALGTLGLQLERALTSSVPASPTVWHRVVERWPAVRDRVLRAVEARADTRQGSLRKALAKRAESERRRVVSNAEQFAATLRAALDDDPFGDESDGQLVLRDNAGIKITEMRELEQLQRDRRSWKTKLEELDQRTDEELAAIGHRYAGVRSHLFPVAVVAVVPRKEATR